jgi:hypothetical protein
MVLRSRRGTATDRIYFVRKHRSVFMTSFFQSLSDYKDLSLLDEGALVGNAIASPTTNMPSAIITSKMLTSVGMSSILTLIIAAMPQTIKTNPRIFFPCIFYLLVSYSLRKLSGSEIFSFQERLVIHFINTALEGRKFLILIEGLPPSGCFSATYIS